MTRTSRRRYAGRTADREDIAEAEDLPPPRRVRRKRRGGKVPGKKAERRIDRRARGGAMTPEEARWASMSAGERGAQQEAERHATARGLPGGIPGSGGTPHRRGGPVARRPVGGAVGQSEAEPSPLVDEQGAPGYEVFPQQRDGLAWGDRESPVVVTPQIERLRQQEYDKQGALAQAAHQARLADRYRGLSTGGRSPRRR